MTLACAVPFCPKMAPAGTDGSGWICRDHWRLVSPLVRAGIRRATERTLRLPKNSPQRAQMFALRGKFWDRAKAQAIERAAGIRA